jgi:myo-inositol 2-dehydrogenase/D-chiro-inositol 1-dehydrogenase
VTLNVGVIGAGNIGSYHIHRLANEVGGARVSAVFDVAVDRARQVADAVGARLHAQASDLVESDEVDAVVIASPGELHAEQVLACITAGKPVLCEKPLATTTEDCLKVVEAEEAGGRQLVQLGFMRRYDPGYLRAKEAVDGGEIGETLLVHCVHRNPTVPDFFTRDMALTDSVIHEIDTMRWLLGEEIVSVSFRAGRKSPLAGNQDPQMVLFETGSGVLVDVESFVNCQYGYDVRCEVVGSEGLLSVDNPTPAAVTRAGARATAVPPDWRVRFGQAFQAEFQDWVSRVRHGDFGGATAWDGYAATAVAEAGLASMASGEAKAVEMVDRPSFYDREGGRRAARA